MGKFYIVYLIILGVLLWFGFRGAPGESVLTTIDQLETQENVFVMSEGEKLDVTVSDEVLTGIEGYQKLFIGKPYLYQITLDDQSVLIVCGYQLFFAPLLKWYFGPLLRFQGMIVSRTANQALNSLVSEYEAQHPDVSVAQRVILYQYNLYFAMIWIYILIVMFLIWAFREKIAAL
jgi:hypothetical protein